MAPRQKYNSQLGIGAIKGIAAIAGISVTFLLLFIFAGSPSTPKSADPQKDTSQQTDQAAPPNGQPAVIRIPDNFSTYTNDDYKFSFAYPTPWAQAISVTTPSGSKSVNGAAVTTYFDAYALGGSVLNGAFAVFVEKQDAFRIAIHPNGAIATPAKLGDSYGWKVVQTGPGDPTLNVGDSYPVKSAKYQAGVTVYNFSTNDGKDLQARWVFQSGDNFIAVSLPILSRPDGSAPSPADVSQYTIISNNIAKTLRPTK